MLNHPFSEDSQGGNPKKLLAALQRWLKSQFGKEWTNAGPTLKIGKQIDIMSCTICMINAISHAVFNDVLWTQKRAHIAHAAWFEAVSKSYLNEVSVFIWIKR